MSYEKACELYFEWADDGTGEPSVPNKDMSAEFDGVWYLANVNGPLVAILPNGEVEEGWSKCNACGCSFLYAHWIPAHNPDNVELCEDCFEKHEVECEFCRNPVFLKDAGHTGQDAFTKYHHEECWDHHQIEMMDE